MFFLALYEISVVLFVSEIYGVCEVMVDMSKMWG